VEAQQFKRFRGVRIVPVVRPETEDLLVPALARFVNIDGAPVHTAPLKVGQKLSILGVGQTQSLLETSILDRTDRLSEKAYLESVYLSLGEQHVKLDLGLPFMRCRNWEERRLIEVYHSQHKVTINTNTRAIDGSKLVMFKEFLDAGIELELHLHVSGSISCMTAEMRLEVLLTGIVPKFPHHNSLQDEQIQSDISADIGRTLLRVQPVGYDLDIDRLNDLDRPIKTEEVDPAVAAQKLAAKYAEAPNGVPR
jgi:hypothetical protein